MTSEVVAMNRMGIALAADSVISVYSDGVHKKKHDSGAKLFMLSNVHPVGIMFFSNASFMGVPWETIIKLFRKSLGHASFDTLEEYGQELIKFLREQDKMFPIEVQQRYFIQKFRAECRDIEENCQQRFKKLHSSQTDDGDPNSNASLEIYADVIRIRLEEWTNRPASENIDRDCAEIFLESISDDLDSIVEQICTKFGLFGESIQQLREIATSLIYKLNWGRELLTGTGLVIGGFGESEHFPVVQRINIGGRYNDVLKWQEISVRKVSEERPSYVESFAITKAVDGFLAGIYTELHQLLEVMTKLIHDIPTLVNHILVERIENFEAEWGQRLISVSNVLATNLRDQVNYRVQSRKKDVLSVVEMLPLSELANVASTLVKLSSFEQLLQPQTEAVGEPIDVAVISKGDGFIWIDRKFYFKNELNYRYFDNLERGILESQETHDREQG
ncbi:MAG: hypothetical protein F4077_00005 [Gammaproteobacteria bacterium]|nr:hypothetical protein [Gammaproteobacteria bacterium]MYI76142.1 hypothetical protein [Gammaproteobacteria bacterium]